MTTGYVLLAHGTGEGFREYETVRDMVERGILRSPVFLTRPEDTLQIVVRRVENTNHGPRATLSFELRPGLTVVEASPQDAP